ncbi:MAG TPA: 3-methyl-2-oxobutanoate hydroxymethyltransferase [Actinomycetota bacterium]|nr:3-methyl-2-oxobutanoate hydroxymethyltransferase [Actinomycetota bacterium]
MSDRRPTLLHSCARAATAAEAGFRVDYPNSTERASRIIAVDDGAAAILEPVADRSWRGARFLTFEAARDGDGDGNGDGGLDAHLRSFDGDPSLLSDELDGADVAVMVATGDAGAEAASIIGRASFRRRIMTAGLVVHGRDGSNDAVNVLRPYASVLVVSPDEQYIADVLTALRA